MRAQLESKELNSNSHQIAKVLETLEWTWRVSDFQSIVSFFGFKPGLLLLKIQLPGILKTSGGPHNEEHLDPLALQNLSINGHRAARSRLARIESARKL